MSTEVTAEVIGCNEASDATEAESSDSDVESKTASVTKAVHLTSAQMADLTDEEN